MKLTLRFVFKKIIHRNKTFASHDNETLLILYKKIVKSHFSQNRNGADDSLLKKKLVGRHGFSIII